MAGAALVDLDKPSLLFFSRPVFPLFFDRFHRAIQHESPNRLPQEVTTAALLVAIAALVLPQSKRQLI